MNLRDVWADTQHARYDFLIADLEVCDTFAVLVETELVVGEPDSAQLVLAQGEARYATIRRLFPKLQNADERNEIEAKVEPASGEAGCAWARSCTDEVIPLNAGV